MAITYHAGRRLQGLSTDATETTNGTASSGTAVVFDASSEVGSGDGINYSGNVIGVNSGANVAPNYWDVAITATAKLKIPSSGVSEMSVTATMSNGGWSKFGLSSTQTDTTTADQGGLCSYGMNIADDGRAWYWDSTSLGGYTQFTGGAATYKITVDSSGVVKFYKDSSVIHTSSNTASGNYYIMAVPYQYSGSSTYTYTYSGDYVEITTGVKPTNVQAGSRFEETDTRKMYHYESGLKYEDDFSTDNWTDNDSTNMGVSGGTFNWNAKRDGSNDASVYDLGSVVSDNWVLRFKLTVTNVSSSTQAGNGFFVGLSDSDQTVSHGTSQDFIGVSIYNDNADTYRAIDADGSAIPDVYSGDSSQTTTYNTGSVWYYEIIKTGSSYTVEAFSNSDYSTGSEGQITGSSNASGLQYLKIINDDMSVPTSTNPFQGTINNLKFYNGVTSSTGNAWKEEGT